MLKIMIRIMNGEEITLKILLINGGMRKGNTYHITQMLLEHITLDKIVEEIKLPKDMPHFCTGCFGCILKEETICPHYEYMDKIVTKMKEADLIILVSPVYVFHVSGPMKVFLDHLGYAWMVHRPYPEMFKKQAFIVTTAAGGGTKSTIKDMKDSVDWWGVGKVYSLGLNVASASWEHTSEKKKIKANKATKKIAIKIQKNVGKVKPRIKVKVLYLIFKFVFTRIVKEGSEHDYWNMENGIGKSPWRN